MGLFNAIDEFFTGSAAEVEMMSATAAEEQREQAQRLNELQDEEETFGLTEKSSGERRQQLTSSSNSNGGGGNGSGGSVKLLLSFICGIVLIYFTYEYGVGNGVKVNGGGGIDHPDSTTLDAIPGTFTKDTLHDTRQAAKELIDLLHNYYGGETKAKAMLVESWQAHWNLEKDAVLSDNNGIDGQNSDSDNDDDDNDLVNNHGERTLGKKNKGIKKATEVLNNPDNMTPEQLSQHHHHKKERTTKLVTTMARALLNPEQTKFSIGTIGSSVAAGHDNCNYDSYENQLERTLTPVFAAAKMALQVQNAGETGGCGDSHKNQVFCVTQNLSPDVDIVHYSWTYFEKGGAEEQREQLVRWAQRMPRRPMVHHLVARGEANTCQADNKENVALDQTYASYGYNAFCIQTGLYFGGYDYDSEIANEINRFGWQHHGDGYHNTTRYGEELPDDDPRKESLGVVYRNWHPGPLGFQIASDAFAYVYVSGLLLALDIIEEDMDIGTNVFERWFDTEGRRVLVAEEEDQHAGQRRLLQLPPLKNMPDPLFCDPVYCSTPHPPRCLNYELPTFGPQGINVDSVTDVWSLWHESNKWNYMVGKVDIAILKKKDDPEWYEKCRHLDACGGITTSGRGTGEIVYDLPVEQMTAGLVFICVCCGKKIAESMVLNNDNLVFKLNGQILDKEGMDLYPADKCVRLLKGFEESGYQKEEKMLLSVEVLGGETEVKISHVVVL